MGINWKVRIKNRLFWIALISASILVIQAVAATFGFTLDLGQVGNNLKDVVNAVFGLLAVLGITIDPTTEGVSDSKQAMTYEVPKAREN